MNNIESRNYDEFERDILKVCPFADIQKDNYGQVVIYTGLQCNKKNELEEYTGE